MRTAGDGKAAVRGEVNVKLRFALFGVAALALWVFPGADCGRRHWELRLLLSSHTAFAGDEFTALVTAEPNPAVGYSLEIDWDDTVEQFSERFRPDTFVVSHRWDSAGVHIIHVFGQTSAGWWPVWSEPETVNVLAGSPHAPAVDRMLSTTTAEWKRK